MSHETALPDGMPDTDMEGAGGQQQPQPQMHDVDESMADTDAELHSARQAQRGALQAEQESLSASRESLVQLKQSMQPGMAQHATVWWWSQPVEVCSLTECAV